MKLRVFLQPCTIYLSINPCVHDNIKFKYTYQFTYKFTYKFENSKIPCYLSRIPFIGNTSIPDYDTRTKHKIHPLKPNHEYKKKCIQNNISLLVSSTPNYILEKIHTHSLQGFSTCA